jgi:anti-anti-sigma factor
VDALKTEVRDGVRIVSFVTDKLLSEGAIQQAGDGLLATAADAAPGEKVVLSFDGVTFMSSAMLGRLVIFHKKCKQGNVELKVCNIAPDIFEVFKITKLNKLFDVCKSEQQALESFNKKGWFG